MYVFRYCPDCGARLGPPGLPTERVVSQTCSACGAVHFRNAKPCAGALVVRDGRVLLGRRAVEPARGCWDIPGGFVEPWEHPADGAVREVAEETGLQVRLERLLSVVVDTYQERDYTLNVYYLAEVVGGTEQPADDLAELGWFGPAELPQELAFPHCARVLAAWQASVRQPGPAQASWMLRERWQALVRGEDCPLCAELAEPDQANPHGFPVAQLEMSRLRLAVNQAVPGYCVLICRRHVREPFELPLEEQVQYWHDLMRAGRAIEAVFEPIKLNFQILGNLVPHLHTHIVPRFYGDPAPGRPLDPGHATRLASPEAAAAVVQRLRAALDSR